MAADQFPWPVFGVLFILAPALRFAWLLRPLRWQRGAPLWLATLPEIVTGNAFWLLALTAVLGLRHPGAWTVAALTKITPCLGPIWFLARREWRNLAWSVAVIGAVTAVSVAVDADAWADWLAFLSLQLSQSGDAMGIPVLPPLAIRLPLALAVVVFGAVTDRRQLIPAAMVLSAPGPCHCLLHHPERNAPTRGAGQRLPTAGCRRR
ncbi:MAG: hypothetical protein JWN68_205 [Nocardioides sp.]|uniref:glycosyltransferase family 87 protein n=1 Tax=Nocardioides sp. TaxID=35761 RepID=UPI002606BE7C|nr:glycosyltransferase family 87 protein [Nocardioides sp.]MCW2832252.1 hypothetical protein [Nocardioides sp.]